ncbi:MAG TPA: cytochrome c oxidase subunit II [Candidatus Binatia bacterium]|nr:cytochrome c oxidase subunit II [Candidatus Binatia bacterium]
MRKSSRWAPLALLAMSLAPSLALAAAYDPGQWNMPRGVSEISHTVFHLHMLIFWVCVVIAVLVFGVMFYSVFAHRRSRHPKPANFHESTTVEIIWTILPFLILIGMAIPAAGTLIKMEDLRGAEMSVKITGFQWKWHYEYVDQGVSFFSTLHADSNRARQLHSGIDVTQVPNYLLETDNHLVLPAGKKIRFLITANDVIHAWWVPDLAIKKDAIPGFVNEVWTKTDQVGTYRGVCAELCGRDHGFMPIVVDVVSPQDFEQWMQAMKGGQPVKIGHGPAPALAGSQAQTSAGAVQVAASTAVPSPGTDAPVTTAVPEAELMQKGEKVYNTQCAACHQPGGQGLPPNFPSLHGSKVANGPAEAHIQQVLKGKNLMPSFAHLSDDDLAASVTYERQSWGNKGGAVQPSAVRAQRGK